MAELVITVTDAEIATLQRMRAAGLFQSDEDIVRCAIGKLGDHLLGREMPAHHFTTAPRLGDWKRPTRERRSA